MRARLAAVREYVLDEVQRPFVWGETDCAMTASRWVEFVTGIHPIADYGRLYTNERQAREWLAERGSIAIGMNRVMRHSGFAKTATPRGGDVGLLIYGERVCVGIHTGEQIFSRSEDGLICIPADGFWKAWRV